MNIPNLYMRLSEFTLLQAELLPLWIIGCVVLMQFLNDWRFHLALLCIQFFCSGLLAAQVVAPYVALSLWPIGLFTVMILYITIRQLPDRLRPTASKMALDMRARAIRFISVAILLACAWGAAQYLWGTNQPTVELAIMALLLLGIHQYVTAQEATFLTTAVLHLLTAVGLWQLTIREPQTVIGLLSIAWLLTAFAGAYFIQRQSPVSHQQTTNSHRYPHEARES